EGEEDKKVDQIAREAAGNPFLLDELARHARKAIARPADVAMESAAITLDDVLWSRMQRLPPAARRLLEIVCVSGRPIAQTIALRAAESGAEGQAALVMLLAEHFVRTRLVGEDDALEAYHDRIRESVNKRTPKDQLVLTHRRLAEVFEAAESPDPEAL